MVVCVAECFTPTGNSQVLAKFQYNSDNAGTGCCLGPTRHGLRCCNLSNIFKLSRNVPNGTVSNAIPAEDALSYCTDCYFISVMVIGELCMKIMGVTEGESSASPAQKRKF